VFFYSIFQGPGLVHVLRTMHMYQESHQLDTIHRLNVPTDGCDRYTGCCTPRTNPSGWQPQKAATFAGDHSTWGEGGGGGQPLPTLFASRAIGPTDSKMAQGCIA
jgi:hypothetical protein